MLHNTLPGERKQGAEERIYHGTIVKKMGKIIYMNAESGYPQDAKITGRDKSNSEVFYSKSSF